MSKPAYFLVSKTDANFFTNTTTNDLLMHTTDNTQKIIMGTMSNAVSTFTITGSNVGVNNSAPTAAIDVVGDIRITGDFYKNGELFQGSGGGTFSGDASNITSGILPVVRGGTGVEELTTDKLLVGNGSNALTTPTNLHWNSSNERLGINTASPAEALHVDGDIVATGEITGFFSDERLKTKTGTLDNALEAVCRLSAFKYSPNELAQSMFREDIGANHIGVSAQDIQREYPELVTLAPFDAVADAETGKTVSRSGENYLTVKYDKLTAVLIQAIKELKTNVDVLTQEVETLKNTK